MSGEASPEVAVRELGRRPRPTGSVAAGAGARTSSADLSRGLLSLAPWSAARPWLPVALSLTALLLWELAVRAGLVAAVLLPAPSTILATAGKLLASGALAEHTRATVGRLFIGLVVGGGCGLLLGLAMGWSRPLREVLDPFVAAAHALPKIAILPLFLILFGVGEAPKLVIAVVAAFFPMLIASMDGVRQISPVYFEVARNYGADWRQVFTQVLLPGCLPSIVSGLRLALNATLLLTVAVEMISAHQGLGVLIWGAWETMRTEQLYVSLAIILVLGVGSNVILQQLAARFIPWRVDPTR